MDRRYTILAILVIVAAFGLLLLPESRRSKELSPDKLLLAINDQARFLSTDKVTERIIAGDPTLQLVDVRPTSEFRIFALPGAVNIPLDSLLNPTWKDLLNQAAKDKVFYSNGDTDADKAWQVCTRNKVAKVFVMKGGLNHWYTTILKGSEPPATASSDELDLYSFRKAAREFFTGGSDKTSVKASSEKVKVKEKVTVTPKPAASSGGGC